MSTTIAGTNNNGQMVNVDFPFFAGPAGLQERDGHVEFAYVGRAPGGGSLVGKIDGEVYTVLSAVKSTFAAGMILVKATKQV